MTVSIQLMVNAGSGVLAAVVTQLQASGVKVKTHKLERVNDTSSLLTVSAESVNGLDKAELKSSLSGIRVVQSVEQIEISGAAAPAASRPAASVEVPEDLVERIVSSYPKIMSHIQNYEEQIAKDPQRNEKLKALGAATGRRFGVDEEGEPPASRSELIDRFVIPRISQIAEAARRDDSIDVRISLFTRRHVNSMDLIGGDDENCYFLTGLIEGIAASVPSFENLSVDEKRCRANGDDSCLFVLG